jgi:hypothetical protein
MGLACSWDAGRALAPLSVSPLAPPGPSPVGKEESAFFKHQTMVGELFRPGTGGARLGEEVPLHGISTGVTSVTIRAHLSKR